MKISLKEGSQLTYDITLPVETRFDLGKKEAWETIDRRILGNYVTWKSCTC